MPLPSSILPTWVLFGLMAALIIRLLSYAMESRPRAYKVLWWVFLSIIGTLAILFWWTAFNATLYSRRGPSGGPDNYLTPFSIVLLLVFLLAQWLAFPLLFALGVSPPNHQTNRQAWVLGAIVASISLLMAWSTHAASERYMADFRAAKQREANADRIIWEWRKPKPPDPQLGAQTWGEWKYLGAFPQYQEGATGGPGSHLRGLRFGTSIGQELQFRDEAFDSLAKEERIESLRFIGIIDDQNVVKLKPLKWIKELELIDSNITDRGLAELTSLESLERLHISGATLTADGLQSLSAFPSLRTVELYGSKTSRAEIRKFIYTSKDWRFPSHGQGIERKRIPKQ